MASSGITLHSMEVRQSVGYSHTKDSNSIRSDALSAEFS